MKQKHMVPMKLTNERVWRTYLGGSLLDEMHDFAGSGDDHFPEEWIASVVAARNAGREEISDEGLSRLAEPPHHYLSDVIAADPGLLLGQAHVAAYGASMGVLVKLIDSSERLAIQVHPDREHAQRLFQSQYGKTECWHILGGRVIDGVDPYVYIGFQAGITRERWQQLFDRQDISGMLACLHRYSVRAGDTILIEGGVPHAIGAGCFLIEIQEPTDYTIRVERSTPSGFAVADVMCHQGLGFERMFECFDYGGLGREENYKRRFIPARIHSESAGGQQKALIDYRHTDYFKMEELVVAGEMTIENHEAFMIVYVLGGNGRFQTTETAENLSVGDQFFVPADSGRLVFTCHHGGSEPLRVVCCFGPRLASA